MKARLRPKSDSVREVSKYRVLGIDPGTHCLGFAVVEAGNTAGSVRLVDMGVIVPGRTKTISERLAIIWDELNELIESSSPDRLVLERAFLGRNVDSVFKLGHARGLALAAAGRRGLEILEVAPRAVKKAVTGSGAAGKDQVARVALARVGLSSRADELMAQWPSDATDALALSMIGLDLTHSAPREADT